MTGKLNIPNTVENIGYEAFYGCTGLSAELEIPEGVKTIGDLAFGNCLKFTGGIVIPGAVKTIGSGAFYGCYGLAAITLNEGLLIIESEAFEDCSGITGSVVIPNSVTSIGERAFRGCTNITEFTVGSGVQTIGDSTFSECTSLNKITSLATTAPTIEYYTFYNVKSNGTLNIPDNCTDAYAAWMKNESYYLGRYGWTCSEGGQILVDGIYYSFDGKTVIDAESTVSGEVRIKEGVIHIAANAFSKNKNITSVVFPNSVQTIGENAFESCSKLREVTFGEGLTSIGNGAFYGCGGLIIIRSLATTAPTIGSTTFGNTKTSGKLIVPEGSNYSSWLANGGYLSYASWKIMNEDCYFENGILYSDDGTKILGNDGSISGEVIIKDGVKVVESYAFYQCRTITSVTIHASVTTIGNYAFASCSGLKQIKSMSTTPPTIGSNTFNVQVGSGKLLVPSGCISAYSTWMAKSQYYLGMFGWTCEEFME